MAIPPDTPDKITYFAETDYRSKRVKFGIRDDDRAKHMYIIGKTGMGKSTMLENLAVQDIQSGEGLCFIDPHGGTAETLLSYVPEHRIKDVIYFAPFDQEYPVALNVMEDMGKDKRPLIASGLIGAFKKVWVDAWSARMEYLLSNALLALFETPSSTLLGVNRMFADKNYRNMVVANVTDPSVKSFWVDEFAKYSDKFATEATAAIQNKIGQFAANPLIRNMVGQPKSTFDIREVMDNRKILIVNLSKGRMGEGNANLVGSMLITKIYLAAMSRADVGAEVVKGLPPFYLYVDEFQSFANESFADILSEARKYKLSLTIAHQYIEQMSEEVRAAVFGNVGSMVSFRVGAYDAEVLEKEYAPAFTAEDMVNLGFAQIYLKLMIRGVGSAPFSATTLPPVQKPIRDFAPDVIASSRALFARPREQVEEDIKKWHEPIPDAPRDPNAPVPETRKYAPGTRPPPRTDNGTARPASRPGTTSPETPFVGRRQADPESLRSALQSVLPKKEEALLQNPPIVTPSADVPPVSAPTPPPVSPATPMSTPAQVLTPEPEVRVNGIPLTSEIEPLKVPKFVVPRAPYAPPLSPISMPERVQPSPVSMRKEIPPRESAPALASLPRSTPAPTAPPVHRPFAEQFAKLSVEEKVPLPAERQTSPLKTPPVAPSRNAPYEPKVLPNPPAQFQKREEVRVVQGGISDRRGEPQSDRRAQVVNRPPQTASLDRRIENRVIPAPASASLSLLKSSPKKDKGPSEERLSSLRDVLRATVTPQPMGVLPRDGTGADRKDVLPNPEPIPKETPKAEFLPSPLEVAISSYTPPPHVPPPEPPASVAPPSPILPEPKAPLRPMEIPEDVLKNILAD